MSKLLLCFRRLLNNKYNIFILFIFILILLIRYINNNNNNNKSNMLIDHQYDKRFLDWNNNEQTLNRKTIYQKKWLRLQDHYVKERDGSIVNDWLWVDILDQVNVLVQMKDTQKFVLFRQKKYGYNGLSLAVVGGQVEPSDEWNPDKAAKREVLEEMQLICDTWTNLGSYRNDVNRGFGWIHIFLAQQCTSSKIEISSDDLELLEKVYMNQNELRNALKEQKFKEVKWTTTIALSLAHLDQQSKE